MSKKFLSQLKAISELLNPRNSLVSQVSLMFVVIILVLAVSASIWVGEITKNNLISIAKNQVQHSALRFSYELSSSISTFLHEMQAIARTLANVPSDTNSQYQRDLLQRLQEFSQYLAWVGYADTNGKILYATDRIHENENHALNTWFTKGLNDIYLSAANGDYVEMSLPIITTEGEKRGVLSARLHWSWVNELINELRESINDLHPIELMVIDSNKMLLLSSSYIPQQKKRIRSNPLTLNDLFFDRINSAKNSLNLSQWQDNKTYMIRCFINAQVKNWTVCAYESTERAYAQANSIQKEIFLIILGLGMLAMLLGTYLLQRIMLRLTLIARAADNLRSGITKEFEVHTGQHKDEITRIGDTIKRLIDTLQLEQYALKILNTELDQRVMERTRKNEQLAEENKYGAIIRERLHIARDLHDTLAHSMFAVLTEIRLLKKIAVIKPGSLKDEIERAEQTALEGLHQARAAITQMRYNPVRDAGLGSALSVLLQRYKERTGINFTLNCEAEAADFADSRAEVLYRIAEEAFYNIDRHSQAQNAEINLQIENKMDSEGQGKLKILHMGISDDGIGFNPTNIEEGHYGLMGMQEQAELINAVFQVNSQTDKGTVINLSLEL